METFFKWFTVAGLTVLAGLMIWDMRRPSKPLAGDTYPYERIYDNRYPGGYLAVAYTEEDYIARHPTLKMKIDRLERENAELRKQVAGCKG